MKQMHLLTYLVFFILIASAASAFSIFGFCIWDCEEPAMQVAALNEPVQIEPRQPVITESFTESTHTTCVDGKCSVAMYRGIKYYNDSGTWRDVYNMSSLINTSIKCVIKKDKPDDPDVECIDFNMTSFKLKVKSNDGKATKIKYKYDVYDEEKDKVVTEEIKIKETELAFKEIGEEMIVTLENDKTAQIHIGENSTTVYIDDGDGEILDDVWVQTTIAGRYDDKGTCAFMWTNYGGTLPYDSAIRLDLSAIPSGKEIIYANLTLTAGSDSMEAGERYTLCAHQIDDNYTINGGEWTEGGECSTTDFSCADNEMCWYTSPYYLGTGYDTTPTDCVVFSDADSTSTLEITGSTSASYDAGYTNTSLYLHSPDANGTTTLAEGTSWRTKEYGSDAPFGYVIYQDAAPEANNPPTIALNSPSNNTAYSLSNPHILTVTVSDTDSDPINMTFYNFTNSAAFCTNNSQTAGAQTKCGLTLAQGDEVKWYVNYTDNGTIYMSGIWNFSITSDTCTYGGSGDWNIDCADNCVISSSDDIGGNDIIITGEGLTVFQAKPTNYGKILSLGDSSTNICRVRLE